MLCFGTFAKVLSLSTFYEVPNIELIESLMRTVDPAFRYDRKDNGHHVHVHRLLNGDISINSYPTSDVKSKVPDMRKDDVMSNFHDTIIPLIPPGNDKLAVLALRDVIRRDDTLDNRNKPNFVKYLGTDKPMLLEGKEVLLSEFLAGIFLYTAVNRTAKTDAQINAGMIDQLYLDNFTEDKDEITINREKPNPVPGNNNGTFIGQNEMSATQILDKFRELVDTHGIERLINSKFPIIGKKDLETLDNFANDIVDLVTSKNPDETEMYEKIERLSYMIRKYVVEALLPPAKERREDIFNFSTIMAKSYQPKNRPSILSKENRTTYISSKNRLWYIFQMESTYLIDEIYDSDVT